MNNLENFWTLKRFWRNCVSLCSVQTISWSAYRLKVFQCCLSCLFTFWFRSIQLFSSCFPADFQLFSADLQLFSADFQLFSADFQLFSSTFPTDFSCIQLIFIPNSAVCLRFSWFFLFQVVFSWFSLIFSIAVTFPANFPLVQLFCLLFCWFSPHFSYLSTF